jgi:hypothetical protein
LPWYLAALGPEQFGLIGFIVMLQAVLGLLDAGISQALVREITVRLDSADGGRRSTAALLFGFERIYWLFALCAGCVTLLLADTLARHWLNLEMPVASGRKPFTVRRPSRSPVSGSLHRSLLVGAQAQVTPTALLGGALLRHVGGVIVSGSPTLTAYLVSTPRLRC